MSAIRYVVPVYGLKITKHSLISVDIQPIYELQKRYNVKTGEITHEERVLIKEGSHKYRFNGIEETDVYHLMEKLVQKYKVRAYFDFDHDLLYIGYPLGYYEEDKPVVGYFGEASLKEICELDKKIAENFPEYIEEAKLFVIRLKR